MNYARVLGQETDIAGNQFVEHVADSRECKFPTVVAVWPLSQSSHNP